MYIIVKFPCLLARLFIVQYFFVKMVVIEEITR